METPKFFSEYSYIVHGDIGRNIVIKNKFTTIAVSEDKAKSNILFQITNEYGVPNSAVRFNFKNKKFKLIKI